MNTDLAEAELADIARHGASIVLCMWEHVHASRTQPCVTVDFATAGAHLSGLRHRAFGALVGKGSGGPQAVRLRGFADELAARGHPAGALTTVSAHDSIEGRYEAAAALLREKPGLTVPFATNDLMAIGAMPAAADLGLRVPANLSVGMTDIQLAHQLRPALTTVRFPASQIAARAIALTLDMIDGIEPSTAVHTIGAPERVVREATGTAPGCRFDMRTFARGVRCMRRE